jgi:hydrogenase expression/formation protein HypD
MKFVDEYRDPAAMQAMLDAIHTLAQSPPLKARRPDPERPWQLMEICGGHTRVIYRFGLDQLLPDCLEFVHGPGCPVCVLPTRVIDDAIALATQKGLLLCCYGDVLRVPGSQGSLQQARAGGASVRVVYSPRDALALATQHPQLRVVFFAIGFETTTPASALTLLAARRQGVGNFRMLTHHIRIEPPLRALLTDDPDCIDGFIGPGHVSTIIGTRAYDFIARDFHKPLVVGGFEPLDLLQSVYLLLQQLQQHKAEVWNQYRRAVLPAGNPAAQAAIDRVFTLADATQWRGLGCLPASGLQLQPAFADFDARHWLPLATPAERPDQISSEEPGYCNDVLTGKRHPRQCPYFGARCTPEHPKGALMVSGEGACAAVWRYQGARPTTLPGSS